jgi:peroxisomal 2,4-dienoyl-CoA reductase
LDLVVEIDLVGTFNLSKACFKALEQSQGCVINISATLHYGATRYQTHAAAAKVEIPLSFLLPQDLVV